jgi:hypothetical protein
MSAPSPDPIIRFVGIYDADGTIVGEIKYMAGKLLGVAKCSLCDLTHGTKLKGRDDFKACAEALPIPLDLFHRNDQPQELRTLTNNALPCIIGETEGGSRTIVATAQQLDDCRKDVGRLETLLREALEASSTTTSTATTST